ncbi:lysine-rich arabinogalactan protein 19-like [Sorghum bicolor]|uniref:lysine-rich arabinogalactan protein 19-like n=1 Tax=Sorghum bicolor TaxID=4558 RepID=UPI000B423C41|nr:lysine-rich arabinogalactan protein 19-like [Sorghum bicolor]|eukprot:XP_021305558.1 lysine-rich arabinogalactan protein 19-like [Sorghum bicolor]
MAPPAVLTAPRAPAPLPRGQPAQRPRRGPRCAPVHSLRPVVPRSAAAPTSPPPAMAPPRLAKPQRRAHAPAWPRSTMDRWTRAPPPVHGPPWTGPAPSRHVAGQNDH